MQTRVVIRFPALSGQAHHGTSFEFALRKSIGLEAQSVQPSFPGDGNSELSWEKLAIAAEYRPARLAKLCQVSLRTLQRHFQHRYNLTVSLWLNQLRVTRAYQRIRSGDPIKQVAYELGFKQLSHFSRSFKQAYGVSPRSIASPSPFHRLLAHDLPPTPTFQIVTEPRSE